MKPSLFITTFVILFFINNPVHTKNIIYTRYVKNLPINHGGHVLTKIFREVFNTKWRPPAYDTTNDVIDNFLKSDPASTNKSIYHLPETRLKVIKQHQTTTEKVFDDSDEYDWDEHIPFTTEKIVDYNEEDYPDEEYQE